MESPAPGSEAVVLVTPPPAAAVMQHGFSSWLRLAWVQIVIVSLVATLSRGTMNALNAVGGLGTGDVQTATMVNLLSSISFTLLSWSSGGIVNMLGYNKSCAIGSLTTIFTLTTLMLFTMYHLVPSWLVWVAATFDGLGSGTLWTAAGTVLIKYPSENKKGFASTVLFAIYSCGAAMGGLLSFAMNIGSNDSTTASASLRDAMASHIPPSVEDGLPLAPVVNTGLKPASYTVMISLAVGAFLLCFFMVKESSVVNGRGEPLSEPYSNSVMGDDIRRDGSRFTLVSKSQSSFRLLHRLDGPSRKPSWDPHAEPSEGGAAAESAAREREEEDSASRLQLPSNKLAVGPPPQSPVATPSKSIVRSMSKQFVSSTGKQLRTLLSTLKETSVQFLVIYSFASLFHQTYLFNGINYKAFNVRTRGLNCFMYWVGRIPAGFAHGHLVDDLRYPTRTRGLHGLTLLLTYVATCQCLAVIFWSSVPEGIFDVAVDPFNTALAFLSFFLYGGLDTVSQSFVLWIFSVLGRRHPTRVPHYVAVFRCFQGLGSSLAWALDINSFASYRTQFLVCAACWLLALPGLAWVLKNLPANDAALVMVPTSFVTKGSFAMSNMGRGSLEDSTQPSERPAAVAGSDETMEIELVRV